MFDRLIDVILALGEDLKFWIVIPIFNQALRLRGGVHYDRKGKPYKIMNPGFHWKIPFWDQPQEHTIVTTTMGTGVQSLITKDGKQVAVAAIVKYSIKDITLFVTEIYDAVDALNDLTKAKVMMIINAKTYDECRDTLELSNQISIKVRAEVKKYGIDVEQITMTDFVETPSYRLFTDGALCGSDN